MSHPSQVESLGHGHMLTPIAHIYTDFHCKFGIPRQSGLIPETKAKIVFASPYNDPSAIKGLEGFSHLWLIWLFSKALRKNWSPTVRPPRLGGDQRMGVFATRSPFRPNGLGLSSVHILKVEPETSEGPLIHVAGADLLNGTPIFDIKPYIPYADCHPTAQSGFANQSPEPQLQVDIPEPLFNRVPLAQRKALKAVLALDPRPSYQNDPNREYAFEFGGCHLRFGVKDNVLTVSHLEPYDPK